MKKIKVIHVIIGSGFGGLEKVVLDLLSGTDRQQFDLYLLCLGTPDLLEERFRASGVSVLSLGYGRGLKFSLPVAIRRVLLAHKIDIVHCHDFYPFFYCALATLGLRSVKKIYTEHSSVYSLSRRHFIAINVLSHLYDLLAMVSDELRTFYKERIHLGTAKIVVVHNGVPSLPLSSSAQRAALKEQLEIGEKIVIGTAVRLIEQKGLEFLIGALPAIIKANKKVLLLIVGDGRLQEALRAKAVELGVIEQVRFLGYRSDVASLLSIMDIYVLPSLWEGLPLGLIEAMLAERPVVATRVGGVPELIIDGFNGRLVPPASSLELSCAIIELLRNEKKRREFGRNAQNHAKDAFSLEAMVSKYHELYLQMMGSLRG